MPIGTTQKNRYRMYTKGIKKWLKTFHYKNQPHKKETIIQGMRDQKDMTQRKKIEKLKKSLLISNYFKYKWTFPSKDRVWQIEL